VHWTAEKIAEYKDVYAEYGLAVNRALASLNIKGMHSKEFREAMLRAASFGLD
jgi:hypothetical protein